MLRRSCLVVLLLVLSVTFPTLGDEELGTTPGGFDLAVALEAPARGCPARSPSLAPAQVELATLSCSASAVCCDGSVVSCSYSGSGTCTGVNAHCPSQSGGVTCPGRTISCPPCVVCCVGCSTESDCVGVCGPEQSAICEPGCDPKKPFVKYCTCID